jgi:hypothetical protein
MKEIVFLINTALKQGYDLNREIIIGDNIIIPQDSDEYNYYVKYEGVWYSVVFDDYTYSNASIEQNDFGGEYYEQWYIEI